MAKTDLRATRASRTPRRRVGASAAIIEHHNRSGPDRSRRVGRQADFSPGSAAGQGRRTGSKNKVTRATLPKILADRELQRQESVRKIARDILGLEDAGPYSLRRTNHNGSCLAAALDRIIRSGGPSADAGRGRARFLRTRRARSPTHHQHQLRGAQIYRLAQLGRATSIACCRKPPPGQRRARYRSNRRARHLARREACPRGARVRA